VGRVRGRRISAAASPHSRVVKTTTSIPHGALTWHLRAGHYGRGGVSTKCPIICKRISLGTWHTHKSARAHMKKRARAHTGRAEPLHRLVSVSLLPLAKLTCCASYRTRSTWCLRGKRQLWWTRKLNGRSDTGAFYVCERIAGEQQYMYHQRSYFYANHELLGWGTTPSWVWVSQSRVWVGIRRADNDHTVSRGAPGGYS